MPFKRSSSKEEKPADVVSAALADAGRSGEDVALVFRLKTRQGESAPEPEATERIASELLDRAATECGRPARRSNIFRNLGSFVVLADADFQRFLLRQPEIDSAVLNRRTTESLKPVEPPHNSRPSRSGWKDLPE